MAGVIQLSHHLNVSWNGVASGIVSSDFWERHKSSIKVKAEPTRFVMVTHRSFCKKEKRIELSRRPNTREPSLCVCVGLEQQPLPWVCESR
jgi:hypothetical protein